MFSDVWKQSAPCREKLNHFEDKGSSYKLRMMTIKAMRYVFFYLTTIFLKAKTSI